MLFLYVGIKFFLLKNINLQWFINFSRFKKISLFDLNRGNIYVKSVWYDIYRGARL